MDDFYEEDEPLEMIEAAFERGEKVFTAPPGAEPIGWHCAHFSMTTGGYMSLPTPPTSSQCGCAMTPTYA